MKIFWLEEIRCEKSEWELGKSFQNRNRIVGEYNSLEDATTALKEYVANPKIKEGLIIVGFIVHRTCPKKIRAKKRRQKDEYCWSFDVEGNELAQSSAERRQFYGRKPEECPFNIGDRVFVFQWQQISMGFIAAKPPTPEEAADLERRMVFPWFHLDETDDCYLVDYDEIEYEHDHPSVTEVFPYRELSDSGM